MIVKKNKTLFLLASCVAISAIASSGCCSGGLKRPNLAALKFWENPDAVASKTPPPPARYFDPSPIQEEQIAQKETGKTIDFNGENLQRTFDQAIAKNTSPIIDKPNTDVRHLSDLIKSNQGKTPVETLQKNLQTAMNTPVKSSGSSTKVEDFPVKLKAPQAQAKLNQSLAGLNKSIYDADGKLVSSTKEVKESILAKLDPSRKSLPGDKMNDFIAAAQAKGARISKPSSNDFRATTLPKSAPLANAFAAKSVSPPAPVKPAMPAASDAELKLVQRQVAQANRQIAELKQQLAQSQSRPQPQIQPQPKLQSQSQPNSWPTSPRIASVTPAPKSTPVASANTFAAAAQQAPAQPVAHLQTPRFGTSNYSTISQSKPDNSFVSTTSPTNILRASNPIQQPRTIQSDPTNTRPAFPSTPHGNFAPQGSFGSPTANLDRAKQQGLGVAPQPATAVNFQTEDNSMTMKASTPMGTAASTFGVQQIQSHASSLDIPASLLNGSGSYAPGSVRPVGQ